MWLILVAGVGNAQPRPWDYETHKLTSALPRNIYFERTFGIEPIDKQFKAAAKLTQPQNLLTIILSREDFH